MDRIHYVGGVAPERSRESFSWPGRKNQVCEDDWRNDPAEETCEGVGSSARDPEPKFGADLKSNHRDRVKPDAQRMDEE